MTMHRVTGIPLLLALALANFGCAEKQAAPETGKTAETAAPRELKYGLSQQQAAQPLVKVGETTVTLGDFAERLGGQSPYLRARYSSPERRREFLENMVRFELLAIEAKRRGLDQSGDVDRVRKQMMVQQMMEDLFEKKGVKLSDITDAEIEKYYSDNKTEFDKPAQMRASQIVVKDKAAAERVLKQALASTDDMQVFRKLAERYNEDPSTKDSFGDLRYFSAVKDDGEIDGPKRPEAVRKAVFALKEVGQVSSELVQTEAGFHIVKLTGKRDALARTLEDARRLIQNRLWRKKREEQIEKFVAELRAKADIKESPELLTKVQVKLDSEAAAPKVRAATEGTQH